MTPVTPAPGSRRSRTYPKEGSGPLPSSGPSRGNRVSEVLLGPRRSTDPGVVSLDPYRHRRTLQGLGDGGRNLDTPTRTHDARGLR